MSVEDKKPVVTFEAHHAGEHSICVKVKPNTQIFKVLKVWANTHNLDLTQWVFMLDGARFLPYTSPGVPNTDTVKDLNIDEDCQIDALVHQIGGAE